MAVRGTNTDPGLSANGVLLNILDNDPAPTTVKLDIDRESLPESDGVAFVGVTATLEGGSTLTEDVSINASIVTSDERRRSSAGTLFSPLVIKAGESQAVSSILLLDLDDEVDDSDETIEIRGTASNPELQIVPDQLLITDDDTAGVTVVSTTLDVTEGQTLSYFVRLESRPTSDVTINIDVPAGAPFTVSPGSLTFISNRWNLNQRVRVTALEDTDAEDEDATEITHTITSADTVYRSVAAAGVSVTVKDDDTAAVTISFTSLDIEEGESATYTVVLSSLPAGDVMVTVGGVTDTDLVLDKTSLTLTFTSTNWDTAQTVTVPAAHDGDSMDEDQVTLTHAVSSTDDDTYDEIAAGEVKVDITDDDTDGVTVSPTAVTVTEGGTATYTVVLDTQPAGDVVVTVTDPTDNTDVTADPASLTFTTDNWDEEQAVTVSAAQDAAAQDESATVKHQVTGYGSVTASNVDVSVEDDAPETVTVSFGSATYSVDETDDADTTEDTENEVTVTVTLSADPERTVTIPLTTTNQGGATSADYAGVPNNVVFNSGVTSQSFTFTATADTVDDDGEKVKLTFRTPLPTGVTEGTTKATTVAITDDDVPAVTVSYGSATYSVDETDDADTTNVEENEVTVTVTLSADPERTVTIPLSKTNQGGASNSDYSGVPASVVFNSGDTSRSFIITATPDTLDDEGESVKLAFGTPLPTAVSEGTTKATTVSITDDDATVQEQDSTRVSFESSGYALTEGGTTEITVTLSEGPTSTVTIPLSTTNQTGATADDYSGVPSSVSFATGETEKSFTFTAVQDEHDENAEEVTLGFGTLPDGLSAGPTAQATVTIFDSLRVSFGTSTYEAYEGGSGAQVTVQLDSAVALETVIPITASGMNGATQDDWTGVPQTLTFSSGEQSKTFIVMAYDDTVEDGGETVELGFGALPASVVAGSPSTATVELMNTEMESGSCETGIWCATVEFADTSADDWGRWAITPPRIPTNTAPASATTDSPSGERNTRSGTCTPGPA